MKILRLLVLSSALSAAFPSVHAASEIRPSGADLKKTALDYLSSERARQVEGVTAKEVEASLAFLTDTAVYEHPKAGARIEGKESIRRGMLGHAGSIRNPHDEVLSAVVGSGVVVLELHQSFEFQDETGWKDRAFDTAKVFEFDGDKIRRIIDYR
ncbi:MAG: nuclear transport factor 2 family protein [Acidobacteria bacterium]|nr:nuclear transport factor 2 family protein [Acidobacteriota bacterium]